MDKQTESDARPNSGNKIPLATAEKWAQEWRNDESTYNKYFECNAFFIPLEDLKEVLNQKGVEAIRAYLGVEEKDDRTFEEKLMIVGVTDISKTNPNGKDMLTTLPGGKKLDPNGGSIYDFTRPCPSACDPNSPLNG